MSSRHEAKLCEANVLPVSLSFSNYVNTPSRIDISTEPMSRQVRLFSKPNSPGMQAREDRLTSSLLALSLLLDFRWSVFLRHLRLSSLMESSTVRSQQHRFLKRCLVLFRLETSNESHVSPLQLSTSPRTFQDSSKKPSNDPPDSRIYHGSHCSRYRSSGERSRSESCDGEFAVFDSTTRLLLALFLPKSLH